VPGTLDVQFNLRFSPQSPAADLQSRVETILRRHGLAYDIEWTVSAEPFLTPAGTLVEAVREAVHRTTGVTPRLSTSGGTSDGRFLAAIADEIVEFGPLNETIHKIDERIAIADLGPLSGIYEDIARTLLGQGRRGR
jgi:succinyl-diaminopimelate desuccinylase